MLTEKEKILRKVSERSKTFSVMKFSASEREKRESGLKLFYH